MRHPPRQELVVRTYCNSDGALKAVATHLLRQGIPLRYRPDDTRAPVIAIGFMVIQREYRWSAPAVRRCATHLRNRRYLAGGGFSTGTAGQVHRIAQFIVTPFAAEGEELVDRR